MRSYHYFFDQTTRESRDLKGKCLKAKNVWYLTFMKFICSAPYLPSGLSLASLRSIPLQDPGLPVSLALGQHHGILCYLDFGWDPRQAVGVHAVWICLDMFVEIQEQSQPTNQIDQSPFGWWETRLLPETVAAVGICRCFEKNFDNLLSLQQKSPKSPPHSWKNQWLVKQNHSTK